MTPTVLDVFASIVFNAQCGVAHGIVPAPGPSARPSLSPDARAQHAPAPVSSDQLLKRYFDIDIKHCRNYGGALKIIAALTVRGIEIRR